MSYVKRGYLKETVHYVSDSGISYKYEIFQRSDGSGFYALLSRLDPLLPESDHHGWIYDGKEINFSDDTTQVQYAVDEVTQQFKDHYKNT